MQVVVAARQSPLLGLAASDSNSPVTPGLQGKCAKCLSIDVYEPIRSDVFGKNPGHRFRKCLRLFVVPIESHQETAKFEHQDLRFITRKRRVNESHLLDTPISIAASEFGSLEEERQSRRVHDLP